MKQDLYEGNIRWMYQWPAYMRPAIFREMRADEQAARMREDMAARGQYLNGRDNG